MVTCKPFGYPAADRSCLAVAGSYLKFLAVSPCSGLRGSSHHSESAHGMALFHAPLPLKSTWMMLSRLIIIDTACRTRGSLNGGWSSFQYTNGMLLNSVLLS